MVQPSPQVVRYGLNTALPAMLACLGCGHSPGPETEPSEEPSAKILVNTAPAETRAIQKTVAGIGRTEAVPNHLAILTPALEGPIREIRASLGDALRSGAVIVEIDASIAQAELAEKEATRDTLKAALDLLQAAPRPEDRQSLEIAIDQAAAATNRAQTALDRLKPLRARGEVSEAQMYDDEQAIVQWRLQQRLAAAQLKLLLAGPRPEAVEEAKSRLAAAEAAVALSRHRLELHFIRSPIDGVLDSLACHPGQTIAAGSPIGEVVDTRQLSLVLWLPPTSVAEIKAGQSARLTPGDSPNGPTESSSDESHPDRAPCAKVISIGQVVDPQTGSLPVRVLLDNPLGKVAIGQTMPVAIVTRDQAEALVVPAAALVDLGEGPLVVVVREGKILQLHPASAATHGAWTVVAGTDLKAGELVVIDGGFHLPEGTPVATAAAEGAAIAEAQR